MKPKFNEINNFVKCEIMRVRSEQWEKLLDKYKGKVTSSRPFWNEINKFRDKRTSNSYPSLKHNDLKYETDKEKANLFGGILSQTFINNSPLTRDHVMIEEENLFYFENVKRSGLGSINEVKLSEVISIVKSLRSGTSACEDGIYNVMLKHLPIEFLVLVTHLINVSIKGCKLAESWKQSVVTMIPKKDGYSADPTNYRPISLCSCLGKLVERVVKEKLVGFLECEGLIAPQQSGFRSGRSTQDNLFFISQKISETLARGKSALQYFLILQRPLTRCGMMGFSTK